MDASPQTITQAPQSLVTETKSETQPREPHRQGSGATATLSCELCRHRKIRCDKGNPCGTCQKAGIKCIPVNRQRLPRGRNGGRRKGDAELKARIGRLENLVKSLESNNGHDDALDSTLLAQSGINGLPDGKPTPQRHTSVAESTSSESNGHGHAARLKRSPFWSSLSTEVSGLLDVLDESSDGDDEYDDAVQPAPRSTSENFSFIMCGPGSVMTRPDALQHPSREVIHRMCDEFLLRVDLVFKVLHRPTLKAFMQEAKPYLDYKPGHVVVEALSFTIYYAVVSQLDETTCLQIFREPRSSLVSRYRFASEVALAKADLVNTNDLTLLQAFMIFLITTRAQDSSRYVWTLLGLAVRIAQGLSLHLDDSSLPITPFQKQMRRRTWMQLIVIDSQYAHDRASSPIIAERDYNTPFPLNIRDDDISPNSAEAPPERVGVTELTIGFISARAAVVAKLLNYYAPGDTTPPSEIAQNWSMRWQKVLDLRREVETQYLCNVDRSNPYDWLTTQVLEAVCATGLLMSVRPLQRHPKGNPPRVSGSAVLTIATEVLEKTRVMWSEPKVAAWRWWGRMYNQWFAIAVACGELCVSSKGPVVDRAWRVVEPSCAWYGQTVADSKTGKLWRPIEKMMRKAKQNRAKAHKETVLESSRQSSESNPQQKFSPPPDTMNMSIPPSNVMNTMSLNDTPPSFQQQMMPAPRGNFGILQPMDWSSNDMWQLPTDWQEGGTSNSDGSPGTAWENWENFVDDIQQGGMDMTQDDSWLNGAGMDIDNGATNGMNDRLF